MLEAGARVVVESMGGKRGMLLVKNADDTWNIDFDDETEADLPASQIALEARDGTKQQRSALGQQGALEVLVEATAAKQVRVIIWYARLIATCRRRSTTPRSARRTSSGPASSSWRSPPTKNKKNKCDAATGRRRESGNGWRTRPTSTRCASSSRKRRPYRWTQCGRGLRSTSKDTPKRKTRTRPGVVAKQPLVSPRSLCLHSWFRGYPGKRGR